MNLAVNSRLLYQLGYRGLCRVYTPVAAVRLSLYQRGAALYYTRWQVRLEACRLTLTRFTDDLTCPEFVLYGFFLLVGRP